MGPFIGLIHALEEKLDLDRRVEAITDDQHLQGYQISGKGLPRSNLSVLVGSAKRLVYAEILGSSLPDDPICRSFLTGYFPKAVFKKFGEALFEHRLRREIVSTMITNKLVEQTGTTYLLSEGKALGVPLVTVAKSYLLADAFLGGDELRSQLYGLDNKVKAGVQYDALLELEDTVFSVNRSLLSRRDLKFLSFENVAKRQTAIQVLLDGLAERLPEATAKELEGRITQLTKVDKMPAALAKRIAYLPFMRDVLRFIRVSEEAKLDLLDVAQAYYQVGAELRFDWIQSQARKVAGRNEWDVQFLNRLAADLFLLQGDISQAVIRGRTDGEAIGAATRRYFDGLKDKVQDLHRDLERLAAAGVQNLIPIDLMRDKYRELLG
jgi:glutamate dehydrogenase